MNFKEATEKLDKITQGIFHSLKYEVIRCENHNRFEQICTVYVDGFEHYSGTTWDEAFNKLETAMNPPQIQKTTIDDVDPVPEIGTAV